ncbi:histidine phosphatase family protein [Burkholderia ubonensis]|uniref:Phosphoglycerate mutase n=1 Tax=Burkholderia ubonensis TaxID=101571 RepID=A0A1R1J2U5_9BURK|nr:histidine phosphatase family protein [Burkholderia ubonensis]OMG69351.1 phosphoglycerate mutase [Burkholderia ubonensis]
MNMLASLHLVAHASTRAMRTGRFPDDDPLDARGFAEAAAIRDQWDKTSASIVLCSPARCARQTADALGLGARVDDALRDVDYGSWRGMRLHDLARTLPADLGTWIGNPSASPHGGESFVDVLRRIGAWLERLPSASDIVAITHAAVIRTAIVHVQRAEAAAISRIDVAPLSCTTFTRSPGGWILATGCDGRHDALP